MLVREYLTYRVAQHTLSAMSARNHRSTLNDFVRKSDCPAATLTVLHVENWLASISHLQPATRRGHFSMVKVFCSWLVRNGHLVKNPTVEVPVPKQPRSMPRALDADLVADLLAECPDNRARAIVWLMVGMGLRCCEVSSAEMAGWDRRGQAMTVTGKGSHERTVPVPSEVKAALGAYLDEYPTRSGPIIRSYRRPTRALTPDALSGMVSEWMRAAEVKLAARDGVSAHALRHTAASDVLDACGDLRVVQEMLGHANLSTTAIYLRRAGLPKMRLAMAGRQYTRTMPGEGQDGAA
ncbi:MAG TPA: tyrosine-type recombinase/integrase [Acidimicrobiales bacterium]